MRGAIAFYASVTVGGIVTIAFVAILKNIVQWLRMIDGEIVRAFAGAIVLGIVAIVICSRR